MQALEPGGKDVGIIRTGTLIDNIDCMREQMGNVSREMEILRESQKEMVAIKKHCNSTEKCLRWA